MAVLHEKRGNGWEKIDQTEIISGCLDPEWVKCFEVPYKFEEVQEFRVTVFCVDDPERCKDLNRQEFIGGCQFTLHEVVTARDQVVRRKISQTKDDAFIQIAGEEQQIDQADEKIIMEPVF